MEGLILELISRLNVRKEREQILYDSYISFGLDDRALISSGKIKEIDRLEGDLEDILIHLKVLPLQS